MNKRTLAKVQRAIAKSRILAGVFVPWLRAAAGGMTMRRTGWTVSELHAEVRKRKKTIAMLLAALNAASLLLHDPDAGDIDADRVTALVDAAIDAATGV